MNKAIKKMRLVEKESKKKTKYTVIEFELINGRVGEVFVDADTVALLDSYGRDKVAFDYVTRESKDGKLFDAIELKLTGSAKALGLDEDYTALYFPSRSMGVLINLLAKA